MRVDSWRSRTQRPRR